MSSLLTPQQRADIRAALKDVTDTFMVTPVTYEVHGESMDQFNEDRTDEQVTEYDLLGLTEYSTSSQSSKGGDIKEEVGGAIDTSDIKVTFNLEDLEAVSGLINADHQAIFNMTKDYFTTKGIRYKVTYIQYEGPLDEKDCLLILYGRKEEPTS